MRAVILNGARHGEDHIDAMQTIIEGELERTGWEAAGFTLREVTIAPCAGCFGCWVKTPGECIMPGASRTITAATIASDLTILLTPVVFGGYSSELKKAVDHQIALVSPFFQRIAGEVHHQPRYRRYPSLLGIGVQQREDEAAAQIFSSLVACHARNFHAPRHSSDIWPAEAPGETLAGRLRHALRSLQEACA